MTTAAIQRKHFGQLRPADTTAASLVAGDADKIIVIQQVICCNVTAAAQAIRLFLDNDGTTYDQTTALVYDYSIDGNQTVIFEFGFDSMSGLYLTDSSGNFAVRTDSASAFNFTANGIEILQRT